MNEDKGEDETHEDNDVVKRNVGCRLKDIGVGLNG